MHLPFACQVTCHLLGSGSIKKAKYHSIALPLNYVFSFSGLEKLNDDGTVLLSLVRLPLVVVAVVVGACWA